MKNGWLMMMVWLQVAGGSVWANKATEWNKGELVLQNGTEFSGELNFNWPAQVLQCHQDNRIKAYSASQVRTFTYFDAQQVSLRKFVSVAHLLKSGLVQQQFLEEVVAGPLMVYRNLHQSYSLLRIARLAGSGQQEPLISDVDAYTFLVLSGGALMGLAEFYRKRWPQVRVAYEPELKRYASRMQWSVTSTIGQLRLICVYNSLADPAFLEHGVSDQALVLTGQ